MPARRGVRVPRAEMGHHAVERVGDRRVDRATGLVARPEHEVVDEELGPPLEQLGERSIAFLGVWKRYSFSTRTHGSSRRSRASSSPSRVCSFSRASRAARADAHSSLVPIGWLVIAVLRRHPRWPAERRRADAGRPARARSAGRRCRRRWSGFRRGGVPCVPLVSPNRRSPAPITTGKTFRRSSSTRSASSSVRGRAGRWPGR